MFQALTCIVLHVYNTSASTVSTTPSYGTQIASPAGGQPSHNLGYYRAERACPLKSRLGPGWTRYLGSLMLSPYVYSLLLRVHKTSAPTTEPFSG